MSVRWIACAILVSQLSCSDTAEVSRRPSSEREGTREPGDHGSKGEVRDVTYHGAIRTIVETHCLDCHVEGGIGPMRLDSLESLSQVRALVVAAVTAGDMPPWPASEDCRDLRDARRLSEKELSTLKAWQEAGFPDGDEVDYTPPELAVAAALSEPDLIILPSESYVPNTAVADEYRCFMTEGTFDRDTYLTAMDIRPGTRAQVHHVQVHKVSVDQLEAIEALDAADSGVGYPCATGAGTGITSVNMFSWRPGSAAIAFESGDAALIEAGSAFVLQVHYNNQFLPASGPVPDLSGVALWTMPEGTEPEFVVTRRAVYGPVGPAREGVMGGVIPAGEPHVVGETTQPMSRLSAVNGNYVPGEIIGMTPHMHGLGTRLSVKLNDGHEDACMVDVPNWDFEWQLDYSFTEPHAYEPEQMLTVRCEYDNGPDNQPILDGMRIAPRDVGWGEGTLDEMCLNYVWLRFERSAFAAAASP